jgi:hypothetical protein
MQASFFQVGGTAEQNDELRPAAAAMKREGCWMRSLGECEQTQVRGRAFGESATFLVKIGLADRSRHAHTTEEKPAVGYCGTRVGAPQA